MEQTFKCQMCEHIFTSDWTDEEAVAELEEKFEGYSKEDCDIVCDDCYKIIMANK